MAADIVKQGYVKFMSKNLGSLGMWSKKWLMLRRQSCKGPLRLEKYKDEETAAVMSVYGATKKIIDLTRVDRIERLAESVKKHGISILVDASLSLQFCVGSEMEAESWISAIRDELHPENRQIHESFQVYMLPNDYMSTSGDCTLQLARDSIRLLERYGGRELVAWPLSGLRRFGVERNMFTFEAGSSCPTGRGTYFFSGGDSEFIFQRVQSLSQAASSRTNSSEAQGNMQTSFSMSNWGNISSIHELSNRRGGGGRTGGGEAGGAGGQTTDQQNPYQFDTTMPTHRPPERQNNMVQSSSRPSNRGQEAPDVYAEIPAESQRNPSFAGQYGVSRRQETQPAATNGVRPSASTSNAVNAAASSTSEVEIRGVGGPYYSVSRPKNTNLTANQGPATTQANLESGSGVRPPASTSNAVNAAASSTSEMEVRAVGGPYYSVARPKNTNLTASQGQPTTQASLVSGNESRRVPMESRTANIPAGPPQDCAQPRAQGQIRAVRVEGDYYAVARGQNANPHQDGSSDLIQLDSTNEQRRGVGQTLANSSVGQGARAGQQHSPYYAASALDDLDDDGVYSVPPVRPGGPRSVRQ